MSNTTDFALFSKLDEPTKEGRLSFVIPQYEYFHQYFVHADCESQLFREHSRGLDGGSFLLATLLNRKDAKTKKGKENIEALEDFYLLKSDAMFNNFFLHKYQLDVNIDNTPSMFKSKLSTEKAEYLDNLVAEALKELIPFFKDA